MNQVEITNARSIKILWGFVWRSWILMIPLGILSLIIMSTSLVSQLPFPKPGEPFKAPEIKDIPIFILIWLLMMVLMITVQVFAVKWLLKTKWNDFKLIAVSSKGNE